MVPIRGILFDFGNVLCRIDHSRLVLDLCSLSGKSPEEVGQRVEESSALSRDYELGLMSSEDFLDRISALLGHHFERKAFIQAFNAFFTPVEETFQLIRRLKPRYLLGLVSNTNAWHAEHTIRRCEVYPLFDAVSLSFEVKAFKPDPRLLEDALRKLGLHASECVFIDDLAMNVEGARRMGMHGLVYTEHGPLVEALRGLGIVC
jgi:HAD superfamily hydrolase (TIGR01509 family)